MHLVVPRGWLLPSTVTLIVFLAFAWPLTTKAATFSENFDSYTPGNLFSQSGWYSINQTVGVVTTAQSLSAPNSFGSAPFYSDDTAGYDISDSTRGRYVAHVYVDTDAGLGAPFISIGMATAGDIGADFVKMTAHDNGRVSIDCFVQISCIWTKDFLDHIAPNTWHAFEIDWQPGAADTTEVRFGVDGVYTPFYDTGKMLDLRTILMITYINWGVYDSTGNAFIDDISVETDADVPPPPGTASNVLFIPGIEGSVLKVNDDTVWPPTIWSDDLLQLALDQDGNSIYPVTGALAVVFLLLLFTPRALAAWKKFAMWFVPLAALLFVFYSEPRSGDLFSPYPEQIYQWISALYVFVSVLIITYKYLRPRQPSAVGPMRQG